MRGGGVFMKSGRQMSDVAHGRALYFRACPWAYRCLCLLVVGGRLPRTTTVYLLGLFSRVNEATSVSKLSKKNGMDDCNRNVAEVSSACGYLVPRFMFCLISSQLEKPYDTSDLSERKDYSCSRSNQTGGLGEFLSVLAC